MTKQKSILIYESEFFKHVIYIARAKILIQRQILVLLTNSQFLASTTSKMALPNKNQCCQHIHFPDLQNSNSETFCGARTFEARAISINNVCFLTT